MKTSGAMLAGLWLVACGADGEEGMPQSTEMPPQSCNIDAQCVGAYLEHRQQTSGNCVAAPADQLAVFTGPSTGMATCPRSSMIVTENGCHVALDATCPDGTHTTLDIRQKDSACDVLSGVETIEIPGACLGTYSITLTRQ